MKVMSHQQDAVPHCDPAQRHESDEARHRQGLLCEHERKYATDERRRYGIENLKRDADRRIQHHEDDEDAGDRDPGQTYDQPRRRSLSFKLPAELKEVPLRQLNALYDLLLDFAYRTG